MKRIPGTVKKSLTAFWPSPGTNATELVLYADSFSPHGAGNSLVSTSEEDSEDTSLDDSLETSDDDGVSERVPERSRTEQALEITQTHKRYCLSETVIGKGQRQARIGCVLENNKPNKTRQQHQQKPALFPDSLFQRTTRHVDHLAVFSCFLFHHNPPPILFYRVRKQSEYINYDIFRPDFQHFILYILFVVFTFAFFFAFLHIKKAPAPFHVQGAYTIISHFPSLQRRPFHDTWPFQPPFPPPSWPWG